MTRRLNYAPALLSGAALALVLAGCGATSKPTATAQTRAVSTAQPTAKTHRTADTAALPAGWSTIRTHSGARLPYPPGWRPIHSDPGTVSAALFNANGTIRAYLNATPATTDEVPATWARFRIRHNEHEERHVRLLYTSSDIALGDSHGPCVTDEYQTSSTSYRELACLVAPRAGSPRTVLVAAAQPNAFASERQKLTFALAHFTN